MVMINVSMNTWQELKSRKKRPSETFDEIVADALERTKNENK